jgi:predicted NBD/HSP70 family sugar kinase
LFTGAVVDMRGNVRDRATIRRDQSGSSTYERVSELVAALRTRVPGRLLGIGVGAPGIVDDLGTVRHAAHLEWFGRPLAADLSMRFGVPARVGNDVHVAALAVLHFRDTQARNLMIVSNRYGISAGLVVAGRLVEGEQFAAGAIGHVTVNPSGPPCDCGRRGCLEQTVGAADLSRRVAHADAVDRPLILMQAGKALGAVLAPIVSALNLGEIVLTGPPTLIDGPLLESMDAALRARTLAPICAALRSRSLAGDGDLVLAGAASLVLSSELGVL